MVLDSDIEKEQPRLAATKEFTTKIANQERTVLESELKTDPTWIKAYKTIHKTQYGTEAEGTDEELSANALNFMADTVYPIATVNGDGLALVYNRFKDAPAEEQAALYYMIDTMEKKDITGRGVKAAFKALGKDPTTYLGLTGVGFFGKAAARETAKKGLIQMLKMGIKSNMGQAAMAGGAYLGGEEAVLQDLKVGAGIQEDINWEDVGVMTGMGAGFGATITAAMPYIMKATGMTVKEIGRFIKERGGEILDTPLGDVITGLQRIVPNEAPMPKEAPQFYSQLETALTETNQKTWNKAQLEGFLAKQGVKTEEMKWSGIQEYLDGLDDNAKVTTQELMDMVNQPQLEKKVLGSKGGDPKQSYYYREFPEVKNLIDKSNSKEDFQLLLENDYDAYKAIMKKHPELEEADDFAEAVADDIFEADSGIFETKYKDYTSKDIDGTNYREELTTLPIKMDVDSSKFKITREEKINRLSGNVQSNAIVTYDGKQIGKYEGTLTDSEIKKLAVSETKKEVGASYKSSHWDEANVLYHVRKQDAKIGKDKTLLIEEVQSDWHQDGRKKGYKTEFTKQEETIWEDYENIWEGISNDEIDLTGILGHTNMDKALELTAKKHNISTEEVKNIIKFKENGIVPQAPYSKTWHEKAMKDQIAEAVEKDYDRVAWVSGKTSADRYSLAKQINELEYIKNTDGTFDVVADVKGGGYVQKTKLSEKELADSFGKEMAEKIISSEKNRAKLKGLDLEVGGEGMKGFYDQMLPKWTDKYIKKYGSKVEVKKLANGQEVWSFKVTDKMKKELKGKGQALYSGAAGVGIAASQQEDNK
jgi:hypothetical protein